MPATPIDLAVVVGSTREGRRGHVVARWAAAEARRRDDVLVDVIDLAEHRLPAVLPAAPGPEVQALAERVDRADAYLVVTPEYNHSYPASLKQAVDLLYTPWRRKPVGFVSYGGISGGLRAAEHLRAVFAELHAATVRETVSFPNFWEAFDDDGRPRDPEGPSEAMSRMLDELVWWARALRHARTVTTVGAWSE